LTTFEVSIIFGAAGVAKIEPKLKEPNQVQHVKISDTLCSR